MAAHEYYNSFNGGTPQMMAAQPAQYAPSSSGTAPPPYQEFNPQAPTQGPPPSKPSYNLADFKYNYDPNINYEPSTPPQEHAQLYRPPQPPRPQPQQQHQQAQFYHTQQPYASVANLRPPPPRLSASTTNLNLRPQRSSSEPPSPYYERKHSSSSSAARPQYAEQHRRHHHSHSHSQSRRRSRSRSRSRERERPRGAKVHGNSKEKNTFLGAIGGSVVGDLIFPGLGTIGGAILGGLGGREAAKKKEERERERERERNSGSGSGRSRRRGRSYEEEWEEGKRRRGEY